MRIPDETEYQEAKAARAVYDEFTKAYIQPNGWTVIPADAPRPMFGGAPLTTDRINAYTTTLELYELANGKPDRFSAYVTTSAFGTVEVVTWTGERIAAPKFTGHWHRNNFGARWRSIEVRADWGGLYYGREYDSRQLVNFRRAKRAA